MNTSKVKPSIRRAYVPTTALIQKVRFRKDMLEVSLKDGRILAVPIIWFPRLQEATPAQRERFEIGGGGTSLHWPELD